jgi:solute carrier family 8 (sodium/calcium exchanger)
VQLLENPKDEKKDEKKDTPAIEQEEGAEDKEDEQTSLVF